MIEVVELREEKREWSVAINTHAHVPTCQCGPVRYGTRLSDREDAFASKTRLNASTAPERTALDLNSVL